MTGRNPYAHGVRNNGHFALAADVPTLAERVRRPPATTPRPSSARSCSTASSGSRAGSRTTTTRSTPPAGRADSLELERRGDRTVAAATAWLAARAARAVAARTSCGSTSTTRTIRIGRRRRSATGSNGRPYDGEIAFEDALVGELLAARRATATPAAPLVVVAGDHGESLGEHGESTHGLFVYEGALRVPL